MAMFRPERATPTTQVGHLRDVLGISVLFVLNNLRPVRYSFPCVAALRRGRIVERADADTTSTRRLIGAVPVPNPVEARARLHAIAGMPPVKDLSP